MNSFCDIYIKKKQLTEKIASNFYYKNRKLLSMMCIDATDLIQMFLIKFYKYSKKTFLDNCLSDKYWVTLCLIEFRLLMLQEYRKKENQIIKVEIEKADKQIQQDEEDYSEYEYLKELIKNKETVLWLYGYTKRAIGIRLYGRCDSSGEITRKINKKINEDILNLQEHLGITKQPIINQVYLLQDKVIRLHLQGLTNTEIAEKLNKTKKQINDIIYNARKSGKLEKQNSIYYKRKMQILSYINQNKDWTYYKICRLFNTDTATIKRYLKAEQEIK